MNTYICRRDGNALEWRTHPYQPGGSLCCWQCEQRLRNGLPLLPEREEPTIAAIVEDAAEDRAEAERAAQAKRERRKVRDAARKREQEKRQRDPSWVAHLDRIRPRPRNAEHVREYWQRKATQLGLSDVA